MMPEARRWVTDSWNWFHRLLVWASIPIALARVKEEGVGQVGLGAPFAFLAAGVTSLGFFPLFALLYQDRDAGPSRGEDVHILTSIRGGMEECLYRGLVLPAVGLGPQAVLFALAHAPDFEAPGMKVARMLQCLLRGIAYGALAAHFGFVSVVAGVTLYDAAAMIAVEVIFRTKATNS